MTRFSISEWHAEQFRLTVFPMPGAIARSPEWWEWVAGSAPDQTTSNPKKGSALVTGLFGPGKLVLRLEPDRIDWLVVPPDLEADALPEQLEVPNVGPLTEALGTFSDIAERWLGRNDLPDMGRIAFGAVLIHTEPDVRSAYLRLPDYVPVQVDPQSSDFLYQINIPVASRTEIDGLQINRLTKWSAVSFRSFSVRFTGATVTPEPVPKPGFALRLELDINTAPGFEGPLPKGRLVEVYRELVSLGREIAAEGTLPR